MLTVLIGFGILVLLYVLLVSEYLHRTVAAGFTAAVTLIILIVMRFRGFEEIILGIDTDTIILFLAMMTMGYNHGSLKPIRLFGH